MEKSPPSLGNCVFLSFFSLFRSLSCLRLNIFETKYRQEAVSYAKETVLCAKKGLGGVDDTEGSMIEVRENVHERGKRKGRKVVERRDWRCIVRATYLTETLRSCERREHIGEQQYPISLTIAGSIERNSSISRIEGFNLAQRTKRK